MFCEKTLKEYIDCASAGTATPGGGSVSALAGALGMSMACMAANFTVGKEKFKDVEERVRALLNSCIEARDRLSSLMQEDAQAYAAVSKAYAMPKKSPEDKGMRSAEIQKALTLALQPPLETVRICRKSAGSIEELAGLANPNLISDVGVAAILCEAALRAAKLNVEVNLKLLRDAEFVKRVQGEIDAAAAECAATLARTSAKVAAIMDASR